MSGRRFDRRGGQRLAEEPHKRREDGGHAAATHEIFEGGTQAMASMGAGGLV